MRELLLGLEDALLRDDGRAQLAQLFGVVGRQSARREGEVGERAVGGHRLLLALLDEFVKRLALVKRDGFLLEALLLEDRLHGEAPGARGHRDQGRVRCVAGQGKEHDVVREFVAEVVDLRRGHRADGEVEKGEIAKFREREFDLLERAELLDDRADGRAAGLGFRGAGLQGNKGRFDGRHLAFGLVKGNLRGRGVLGVGLGGRLGEGLEESVDARHEHVAPRHLRRVVGRGDGGGFRSGLGLCGVDDAEVAQAAEHVALVAG